MIISKARVRSTALRASKAWRVQSRWRNERTARSRELKLLSDDDIIWEKCAHHLGGLCATLLLVASPEKNCVIRRSHAKNRFVPENSRKKSTNFSAGTPRASTACKSKKGLEKINRSLALGRYCRYYR